MEDWRDVGRSAGILVADKLAVQRVIDLVERRKLTSDDWPAARAELERILAELQK